MPQTDRVRIIEPAETYVGLQGFTYRAGVSRETVGETACCMNVLPMPPGARAKPHTHKGIDTIAYLLEGRCAITWGDRLEHRRDVVAGEMVFMPADVPHAPVNDSGAPCTWIVVHSSGSDQDDIVLMPELERFLPQT